MVAKSGGYMLFRGREMDKFGVVGWLQELEGDQVDESIDLWQSQEGEK